MYGGLKDIVKEELARKEAIKDRKLQMEASEYFKDHPHQKKDDKNHDKDFKSTSKNDDFDIKRPGVGEVMKNNEKTEKKGETAKVYKDGEEADNQDFYNKEQKSGKNLENNKDSKVDSNEFSADLVKWYQKLNEYKKG